MASENYENQDFEGIFFSEDLIQEIETWSDSENDWPYCPCEQPNDRDMISCDSSKCEFEWWHYSCANLTPETIPEGDWICPECKNKKVNQRNPNKDRKVTADRKKKQTTFQFSECEKNDVKQTSKPDNLQKSTTPEIDSEYCIDDAHSECTLILQEAVQKCKLSAPAKINKKIMTQLTWLLSIGSETIFRDLALKLIDTCWSCVVAGDQKVPKTEGFERICSKYYQSALNTNSPALITLKSVINVDGSIIIHQLYQLLLLNITRVILERRFGTLASVIGSSMPETKVTLSTNEEQVLRYVCGYIPFCFIKHFKKYPKNEFAVAAVTALQQWHDDIDASPKENSTFLNYTRAWIELLNKGSLGLFQVSDTAFRFFLSAEVVVKESLNEKNIKTLAHSENVKEDLIQRLYKSDSVSKTWNILSADLNTQLADNLKKRVLKKFTDIRCNSFCSVYLNCMKLSNTKTVSSRGEKSLRKELRTV